MRCPLTWWLPLAVTASRMLPAPAAGEPLPAPAWGCQGRRLAPSCLAAAARCSACGRQAGANGRCHGSVAGRLRGKAARAPALAARPARSEPPRLTWWQDGSTSRDQPRSRSYEGRLQVCRRKGTACRQVHDTNGWQSRTQAPAAGRGRLRGGHKQSPHKEGSCMATAGGRRRAYLGVTATGQQQLLRRGARGQRVPRAPGRQLTHPGCIHCRRAQQQGVRRDRLQRLSLRQQAVADVRRLWREAGQQFKAQPGRQGLQLLLLRRRRRLRAVEQGDGDPGQAQLGGAHLAAQGRGG